ncbi:2,3-bisphosphoglycerate-independent phosphoglycerate mutase [Candidatus Tiddalikarchaeum anstoanum]|nr:2,3-bisphosphoglycerate-independent phosphoglycerate mutase [Candidatus Tiddalikarchaeum anstoanum]
MKYLYIVLDGATDADYKELDNKSPLGYANMKSLNSLASKSQLGRVEVVGKDIPPESDSAVMSLLGYDIKKYYPGRGIIEALGAGFKPDGSIFFRANYATINDKWDLIDTRAGRVSTDEAKKFSEDIKKIVIEGVEFEFKHTIGHRGIVKIKGKDLSDNVTGNHNGYKEILGLKVSEALMLKLPKKLKDFEARDNSPNTKRTADLLNKYAKKLYEILSKNQLNNGRTLPVNMLLLRGASSTFTKLPSMKSMTGLNWAALVEMPVEEGICQLADIKTIFVGKETDTIPLKCREYYEATINNIGKYDALYVHIKGADIPGHDGKLMEKVKVLKTIDKEFFTPLFKKIDLNNTFIAVTSDHSTECAKESHTARPTALLVYTPGIKSDNISVFDENHASKGSIGTIKGTEVIKKFI